MTSGVGPIYNLFIYGQDVVTLATRTKDNSQLDFGWALRLEIHPPTHLKLSGEHVVNHYLWLYTNKCQIFIVLPPDIHLYQNPSVDLPVLSGSCCISSTGAFSAPSVWQPTAQLLPQTWAGMNTRPSGASCSPREYITLTLLPCYKNKS